MEPSASFFCASEGNETRRRKEKKSFEGRVLYINVFVSLKTYQISIKVALSANYRVLSFRQLKERWKTGLCLYDADFAKTGSTQLLRRPIFSPCCISRIFSAMNRSTGRVI